LAVQSW